MISFSFLPLLSSLTVLQFTYNFSKALLETLTMTARRREATGRTDWLQDDAGGNRSDNPERREMRDGVESEREKTTAILGVRISQNFKF
jgi:hypothetical protein